MIRAYVAALDASVLPFIPRAWTHAFWQWATLNAEAVVLEVTINLWVWKRTEQIRLRHLFPIFDRMFGRPIHPG